MSAEAKEFLIKNGYMDSYIDDLDICNILEEYLQYRIGDSRFADFVHNQKLRRENLEWVKPTDDIDISLIDEGKRS